LAHFYLKMEAVHSFETQVTICPDHIVIFSTVQQKSWYSSPANPWLSDLYSPCLPWGYGSSLCG
jgi:hypothetical protein